MAIVKKKKILSTYEIAVFIAMSMSEEIPYLESHTNNYCSRNEKLQSLRAKMLDESQWFAVACGIVAACMHEPDIFTDIMNELSNVYKSIDEHNGGGTMYSEDNMEEVFRSLLEYLKEFFMGLSEEDNGTVGFARGQVYLCDVFNKKIFGGYPKPGSVIDRYTRELSEHFFILFDNKFSQYSFKK